jgi:hypothetical protein
MTTPYSESAWAQVQARWAELDLPCPMQLPAMQSDAAALWLMNPGLILIVRDKTRRRARQIGVMPPRPPEPVL